MLSFFVMHNISLAVCLKNVDVMLHLLFGCSSSWSHCWNVERRNRAVRAEEFIYLIYNISVLFNFHFLFKLLSLCLTYLSEVLGVLFVFYSVMVWHCPADIKELLFSVGFIRWLPIHTGPVVSGSSGLWSVMKVRLEGWKKFIDKMCLGAEEQSKYRCKKYD